MTAKIHRSGVLTILSAAPRSAPRRMHFSNGVERMPGTNSNGQVGAEALKRWVIEARNLCKKHGRVKIGDQTIGWMAVQGSTL